MFFEPNNSCAVLNYVKTHFQCNTRDLVDPGYTRNFPVLTLPIPGDDGNNDLPDEDGPYNENDRKPIWWYHSDHLGSSTYLTDNFGRPSHYYETLPFGEMIVEHNQSSYYKDPYPTTNTGTYDNKWKFNGKELDDATGMYYYGARYYDPRISIFVSVDPLAEQTMEPYLYTGNNPIMFTDPTGMSKEGGEHDYRLNRDGSFTLINPTDDEFDRIYADDDSQAPLVVEKSFLQTLSKPKYEGTYEAKISENTLKTYGKALFDFFSNNSDVEWKYNEFYNLKNKERFANILTSFKDGYIRNPNYYIEDILDG